MTQLKELQDKIVDFRTAREWKKFHTIKNLSAALSIESAEVLELSLWKTDEEISASLEDDNQRFAFADELADVFMYLMLLADRIDIDLAEAVQRKIQKNEMRFPLQDFKGSFEKSNRKEI